MSLPTPANPNRERVLAFIVANPGCSRQDIADAVGLTRTAVAHHVQRLRRDGTAQVHRHGRRLLHVPRTPLAAPPTLLGLLRLDGARRVLEALAQDPGRSVRSVARAVGLAPHSVRWHLARFQREGMLEVRGSALGRRFELHPHVRVVLSAAPQAASSPSGGEPVVVQVQLP